METSFSTRRGKAANMETPPLAVRPEEAARLLGVSRTRVYELIAAAELTSFVDGARRLILTRSLHEWLERKAQEARTA